MEKPKIIIIVGPTATGKSALGIHLAQKFRGEIINADSMQIYRGLDIGTAKPTREEQTLVRHHLIDILDLNQIYSAARFREEADQIIKKLHKDGIPIFIIGGTGLYLKVLTKGIFHGPEANLEFRHWLKKRLIQEGGQVLYQELSRVDPEAASRIHPRDHLRIIRALEVVHQTNRPISSLHQEHGFKEQPYEVLKIGLSLPKEELFQRIEFRIKEMLRQGWVEEVRNLLAQGYSPDIKPFLAIGYKQIIKHLSGQIDFLEMVRLIIRETKAYAKRQITWFKADPEINWFHPSARNWQEIEDKVEEFLK
ncbi:MAG: tRNA (adenosine(37)-N6)-dimethylallyltransferase MiaA [Thermodesulfobacteriota bacterium]